MAGSARDNPEVSVAPDDEDGLPSDAAAQSGREPRHMVPEVERSVRALQAGADPAAFETIYRAYYRPLFYFFANQQRLREDADDLAQETLLRAFEKIHTYDFRSDLIGWLRRIAENVWRNALRSRQTLRRGGFQMSLATSDDDSGAIPVPEQPLFGEPPPNPEQQALQTERCRVLETALAALPAGMRRCTELRLGHDLKYEEIATVMGIGLGSVRSQLFEARKRLRPVLDRYFSGAEL